MTSAPRTVCIQLSPSCLTHSYLKNAFSGYDITIKDDKIFYRNHSFRILFCNNTLRLSKFPNAYEFVRQTSKDSIIPTGVLSIDFNIVDKYINEIEFNNRNSKSIVNAAKFNLQIFESFLTSVFDEYFSDIFNENSTIEKSKETYHNIVPKLYIVKYSTCSFDVRFRHGTEPCYIANTDVDKLEVMIGGRLSFVNESDYNLNIAPLSLKSEKCKSLLSIIKGFLMERTEYIKTRNGIMYDYSSKLAKAEADFNLVKQVLNKQRAIEVNNITPPSNKESVISLFIDADLI
jgi:hypothetical protein